MLDDFELRFEFSVFDFLLLDDTVLFCKHSLQLGSWVIIGGLAVVENVNKLYNSQKIP